ncbi:hypothetical protein F5878DRAFT_644956 [Lentinula raphanica]|uniref:Uncharacterized protein n=1 Tax=Lentinula raphanica TaxID=153919 RepID=A0AA38P1P5_9AGAR|nr:hypothetical protein F5878DRAFT_644956 [Lentinula raphanica]
MNAHNSLVIFNISVSLPTLAESCVFAYLTRSIFSSTATTHSPLFVQQPLVMITFNSILLILLSTASVMLAAPPPRSTFAKLWLTPLKLDGDFPDLPDRVVTIVPKLQGPHWIFNHHDNVPLHPKPSIKLRMFKYRPKASHLRERVLSGAAFNGVKFALPGQSNLSELKEQLLEMGVGVEFEGIKTHVSIKAQVALELANRLKAFGPSIPKLPFENLFEEVIFAFAHPAEYDLATLEGKSFNCNEMHDGTGAPTDID